MKRPSSPASRRPARRALTRATVASLVTLAVTAGAAPAADATTYVGVVSVTGGYEVVALQHPRTILLGPVGGSNAQMMYVRRVHWRDWGHRAATGKGRTRFRTYEPWSRVTLKAYRRKNCTRFGFKLYTRVRSVVHYAETGETFTHVWRQPSCSVVAGWQD